MLELGCGSGRLSGHLIEVARNVHGIDIAPAMVAHCRAAYPSGTFSVGDLRDLSQFGSACFEAVVAPFNVLDVLDDAERNDVLGQIARVVVPGGLLIMSSHNLAFAPSIERPWHIDRGDLRGLLRSLTHAPRRMRNRRRLAPLQRRLPGYSILNDEAHDFALLHYYVSPDAQALQLQEHGFALLECLDLDGRPLTAGDSAAACPELHYVARLTGAADGAPA